MHGGLTNIDYDLVNRTLKHLGAISHLGIPCYLVSHTVFGTNRSRLNELVFTFIFRSPLGSSKTKRPT